MAKPTQVKRAARTLKTEFEEERGCDQVQPCGVAYGAKASPTPLCQRGAAAAAASGA